MLRRISGTLLSQQTGQIVVDVLGAGFLIHTCDHWQPEQAPPAPVTVWTHLAVRENSLDLYGFTSEQECAIFEYLLTIPKIGPKSALQIMNKASTTLLLECTELNDPDQLAKRSGIGKKTAEKIVVGLRESGLTDQSTTPVRPGLNALQSDAEATLVALGYSERDAYTALQIVNQEQPDLVESQALIRAALQILSQQRS